MASFRGENTFLSQVRRSSVYDSGRCKANLPTSLRTRFEIRLVPRAPRPVRKLRLIVTSGETSTASGINRRA